MLSTCKCCSDSRGSKPAIIANACEIFSRLGKHVGKAKPACLGLEWKMFCALHFFLNETNL